MKSFKPMVEYYVEHDCYQITDPAGTVVCYVDAPALREEINRLQDTLDQPPEPRRPVRSIEATEGVEGC